MLISIVPLPGCLAMQQRSGHPTDLASGPGLGPPHCPLRAWVLEVPICKANGDREETAVDCGENPEGRPSWAHPASALQQKGDWSPECIHLVQTRLLRAQSRMCSISSAPLRSHLLCGPEMSTADG